MPYKTRKIRGKNCYKVYKPSTKRVFAKCTTKENAKKQMEELTSNNEKILADARLERETILKEARAIKEKTIADAKNQASNEAEKIITSAKEQINNEKMKAMTEIKNQVADISIEMAEKILGAELKDAKNQKKLIEEALKKQIN